MTGSEEFSAIIGKAKPSQSVISDRGSVELYTGTVADQLLEAGILNLLVRDHEMEDRVVTVRDVQMSGVDVGHQEGAKPNASVVVGIAVEGLTLLAQHWEGFESSFDLRSLRLTGQSYTK